MSDVTVLMILPACGTFNPSIFSHTLHAFATERVVTWQLLGTLAWSTERFTADGTLLQILHTVFSHVFRAVLLLTLFYSLVIGLQEEQNSTHGMLLRRN